MGYVRRMARPGGCRLCGFRWRWGGFVPEVEFGEELLLDRRDRFGVAGGDLGGGVGLGDGALGFGSEEFAVCGGVGVALRDSGCNAARAGFGRPCGRFGGGFQGGPGCAVGRGLRIELEVRDGDQVRFGLAAALGTVRGETVGDLLFKGGAGAVGRRCV